MIIGITERGDAGRDLSWQNKQWDGAILITKTPNKDFMNTVLLHPKSDNIIIHFTCTGYGSTVLEPGVEEYKSVWYWITTMRNNGFPVDRMVLRVDPIIPTEKGLLLVDEVLNRMKDTGIKRVRYSFLDMYPHVIARFNQRSVRLPYPNGGFAPSEQQVRNALNLFNKWWEVYSFESCAEETIHKVGCISKIDIDLMGLKEDIGGSAGQRKGCMCPSCKTELLNNPKRCESQCLYCYWRN